MTAARHVLTIIAVADLARARRFYADAFGWLLQVDAPSYAEFALPGGTRFGVYERRGFARNTGQLPVETPAGALSPTELYFHVEDLIGAIDRVRRAGGRCLSELSAREWGDEAAYFADPDGNVLVLARPLRGAPG